MKLINVFFGSDNLPYKDTERQVHFPIAGSGVFLGASNTTKIRFYYDQIGDTSTTWVSVAKLPNGKQGSQVLSKSSDDNGNYAELELSNWYTQAKGDVYIALQGYQGGINYTYDDETGLYTINGTPTIQTTGSIKLAINYAPVGDSPDYNDEFTTYQQILAALGDKLDVLSGIVVVNNINTETIANYEDGQMFFSLHDKQFYKKVSGLFELFKDTRLQNGTFSQSSYVSILMLTFSGDSTGIITISDGNYAGRYLFFYKRSGDVMYYPTFVCLNTGRIIWSTGSYGGTTTLATILSQSQKFEWYSKSQVDSSLALKADKSDTYTKSQVDDLIGSVKQNEFQVVSELPEQGEEGIIYLIPIDPSDTSLGYDQYIWEESENDYIYLGTTNLDLRNYYTKDQTDTLLSQKANSSDVYAKSQTYSKTETDDLLATKEDVSNKTTTLSGSSTDTQYPSAKTVYERLILKENVVNKVNSVSSSSTDTEYPSAKCVYTIQQALIEIANGNCKTIVLSYQKTAPTSDAQAQLLKKPNGTAFIGLADFASYVSGLTLANSNFNTQNAQFIYGSFYLISVDNIVYTSEYIYNNFKVGDLILVVETDVPDRWLQESGGAGVGYAITFYKLETTKVDLSGFYSKTESLLPATTNTYDLGSSTYTFKDAYIGGKIIIDSIQLYKQTNLDNLVIKIGNYERYRFSGGAIVPVLNNYNDLGTNNYQFKDLYLAGKFIFAGSTIKGFVKLTQADYDALVSGGTVDADTFYFIEE